MILPVKAHEYRHSHRSERPPSQVHLLEAQNPMVHQHLPLNPSIFLDLQLRVTSMLDPCTLLIVLQRVMPELTELLSAMEPLALDLVECRLWEP